MVVLCKTGQKSWNESKVEVNAEIGMTARQGKMLVGAWQHGSQTQIIY